MFVILLFVVLFSLGLLLLKLRASNNVLPGLKHPERLFSSHRLYLSSDDEASIVKRLSGK